jgi:hypothetical protein
MIDSGHMKFLKLQWLGHVARMEDAKNLYRILMRKVTGE